MALTAMDSGGSEPAPLPHFSSELQFVVAAARLALGSAGAAAQLAEAVAGVRDWDIARRGLVHHGLIGRTLPALLRAQAIPAPERAAFEEARGTHDMALLKRVRELVRIAHALDAAGIRHLFLKGIVLSVQLYGDPLVRTGRDIDILIERARMADAEALLRDLGYARPWYAPAPAARDHGEPPKESAWVHRDSRILVELHDRLCENPALLPWDFERLWAERESVALAGRMIPAMARRRLPVYLATHGIRHGWQRLLWLADLAVLLDQPLAWEQARADAKAMGMAGMLLHVGWALRYWLARPVPAGVLADGARRIDVALLNRLVRRFQDGSGWYAPLPHDSLRRLIAGSVWSRAITYLIKPTRAFWGRQLAWDLSSPQDRAAFPLPAHMVWLYPLIRPFGWAIRRLRG